MHLLVAASLAAAAVSGGNAADRLGTLSSHYLDVRSHEDPVDLVSVDGEKRRLEDDRAILVGLAHIDRTTLSREAQVDAALLTDAVRYELWRHDTLQDYAWDVQRYQDLTRDALSGLPDADAKTTRERLLGAAQRFRQMPAFFARIRLLLDVNRVPASHARLVAAQNRHLLDGQLEPLLAQVNELNTVDRQTFETAVATLRASVAAQQQWLDTELVPNAKGSFRLGAALYDAKARFELGTAQSRPEIEASANASITEIRTRMYTLARLIVNAASSASPLPAHPDRLTEDAGIRAALAVMESRHPTRAGFVPMIRSTLEKTTTFVRSANLVGVPDRAVDIVDMPADMQGIVPAFYENLGERSVYAISLIPPDWTEQHAEEYLRAHNDSYLENLTIHEAMPGHYLQATHLRANASPLRQALGSRSFAEGWAVYGQQMMVDAGYLHDDPLFELAELQWQLGSACNALLDIGVQTRGWTREQGLDLLIRTGFQRPTEAASKWDRATLTSTQLLTYFVGYTEHTELRDEVRRREGKSFNQRNYNDRVLSYGMPPVRLVRALMLGQPITPAS